MRLVLVHGIAQEGKSEDKIKTEWLAPLAAGIGRANALAGIDVRAPFYGDRLAELTAQRKAGAKAQGPEAEAEEAMFISSGLGEQAQAAGIGAKAIVAEERAQPVGGAVEQGLPMNRRINAIVRVLEKVSPLHGQFAMRLLGQAYAYLKRPGVDGEIDAIVRPVLDAGPAAVVGHSLGTVVTFKLLRQLALENRPIKVPLFITVGSPLPLMAIQAALGPAFSVPTGVACWLNAVDPDDFIALGRGLDQTSFSDGIENILDIRNIPGNPHSIEGYLRDGRVASRIATACAAGP